MASFFPSTSSSSVNAPLLEAVGSLGAEDYANPLPNVVPIEEQDKGVTRIEALHRAFGSGRGMTPIWMLYFSIGLISFAYSLSTNTVRQFLTFATSAFGAHSLLGSIEVAIYILGAVSKPFIAKLSDITSRPVAYLVSLGFYVLGFLVVATAQSVQAVAAGELLYTVGNTGISLVTEILVADLSPLKWRGFMSALPASPYIINAFISGYIVKGFGPDGWRWGYGIFAIIMPVVMFPALVILFWADFQAKRMGALSISASSYAGRLRENLEEQKTWFQLWASWSSQIDAFGLLLLGSAWALVLLPITLYRRSVEDGGQRNLLIAMFFLGVALLGFFFFYEKHWAVHPMMPMRVLNRTFICSVTIDFFDFVSSNMRSTYLSSWTYVVKDWSLWNWNLYMNSSTIILCIFALIAGAIQRATHRYKRLQIFGLFIRFSGVALILYSRGEHATDVNLILFQFLVSIGGAFSVVGSRVASQASVPHQDMATVIALLSLWTSVGSAIGSAAAAAIWTGTLPENLTKQLSGKLTAKEILDIYSSTKIARNQPRDIRNGIIQAYDDTVYHLYLPALLISIIPLIAAFITKDLYLGDSHNSVERKTVDDAEDESDHDEEAERLPNSGSGPDSSSPEIEVWSPNGTTKRVLAEH